MEKGLILVIDLDATLISGEIAKRMYKEAYAKTLKMIREKGVEVPKEFYPHTFENYCKLARKSKLFKEIYKDVYEKVLERYICDIRKEKEMARVTYEYLVAQYKPKDMFILTANPKGDVIVKEILPEVSGERILIVDGCSYVEEKKRELMRLKSLGKVIYVADRDELDLIAAKEAGVNYVNVFPLIEELRGKRSMRS